MTAGHMAGTTGSGTSLLRIREFRPVATRYDRTAASFRATFLLAAAMTAAR